MAMSTEEIMQLALKMSGFREVPADSAIYTSGVNLKNALIGIDLDAAELFIAKQLGFDLVISHHPQGGSSTLRFPEVLHRHTEMMIEHGVPKDVAEQAMAERIYDARCQAQIANYDHAPSFARMLNVAYMNIHLPLDEIGRKRMVASVKKLRPQSTVRELMERFQQDMSEFRNAKTQIEIRVGRPENKIGRVVVAHACGTNGGYAVAKAYFEHGMDTVIYIHCSGPDSRKLQQEFQSQGKNLIVTGHIASDSLGINPLISELEQRGLRVTRASGVVPP
jgi:putative NIF3 family GTP cyclohydrolase 1 type 2